MQIIHILFATFCFSTFLLETVNIDVCQWPILFVQCFDSVGWVTWRASDLWNKWVLVCWWWWNDWSFAHLTAAVVTTTSIILRSNKIQNGDILVLTDSDPPGKMSVKLRERESPVLYSRILTTIFQPFFEDNPAAGTGSDPTHKPTPSSRLGWVGCCLTALSAQIGHIVPCPPHNLIV